MLRTKHLLAATGVIAAVAAYSFVDFQHDGFVPSGAEAVPGSKVFSPPVAAKTRALARIPKLGAAPTHTVKDVPEEGVRRVADAPQTPLEKSAEPETVSKELVVSPTVLKDRTIVREIADAGGADMPLPIRAPNRPPPGEIVVGVVDPLAGAWGGNGIALPPGMATLDVPAQVLPGKQRRAALRARSQQKSQPPVSFEPAPKLKVRTHRDPFANNGN